MQTHASPAATVRPLLKWAGGKRQLLTAIGAYYPPAFSRYIEPFFGSGAVFFDLATRGLLKGRTVRLADVNPDLVGCYLALRDSTDAVVAALTELERTHRSGGSTFYYEVRDRRFNPARSALALEDPRQWEGSVDEVARVYTPEVAAMLIFLNRTGFNGLFRLNRDGAFNVPAGRYTDPRICDPGHLRSVAAALGGHGVTIEWAPFDITLAGAGAGDFVYCDPPYAPLSKTASFAQYTAAGFSTFDQARLQHAVVAACRRGAHVVLSNSSAQEIVDLYSMQDARQAGLAISRVPARRAINSRAASRGPVDELIISNVPLHADGRTQKLDAVRGKAGVAKMPPRAARRRTA